MSKTGNKQFQYNSNISRSKGIQTMTFGQFIQYNFKNIFLEKSYTTNGGKTIPRPFPKRSKLSIQ